MGNFWNNLFTSKSERRSVEGYRPASSFFAALTSPSRVTEETAMSIGAVYGCVRVLSESIAKLPFHVYERTDTGKNLAPEHPVYTLINSEPNEIMTAFTFWQSMVAIAGLWGNSFARIVRGPGERPVSLKLYKPGDVTLTEAAGMLFAKTPDGEIPYYDIYHLRGLGTDLLGVSPIRYAAENLGITLNAQKFGLKFFENGANVGTALRHPGKLGDAAYQNLKNSFDAKHSGLDNAHKPIILEEGMDITRMGIPPEEAQFIQTRQFGIADICRIFGVPPHKIADLSNATFSNIEQQNIEFVNDSIMPWLRRIEQEANRKLFRDAEKGKLYCKFNVNGLMRGDSQARAIFYKEMFGIGVFSQNDIRDLEDQNRIEGGDRYYVQGNNMVPIDMIDTVLQAKTGPNTTKTDENEG